MRYVAVVAALVAILLVGCGGTPASPSATPSTTPTEASSLPFEPETFTSRQLGISFQYPRSWRLEVDLSDYRSSGMASVKVVTRLREERQAMVRLLVKSLGIAKGGEPGPYMDAPLSYRGDVQPLASASFEPITDVGFTALGGLRLLSYRDRDRLRASGPRWPVIRLYSRNIGEGANPTQVIIVAGAPDRDWSAQRETLLAILGSMRFSTPQLSE